MLSVYSVALFGHRRLDNAYETERSLREVIKKILSEKEYVEFLIGRNGDFDLLAASVIRSIKREYRSDNSALVLVLPYQTAEYRNNEEGFLSYYDEVEICEESASAHFKSAIGIRNKKTAERADCIICHIERETGGAYTVVDYARKLGKEIVEI